MLVYVWIHGAQLPPKGHPEEMQKAMSRDERELGSTLMGLSQANDGLLKEASEMVLVTEVGR
jgi:hypothetical protein